MNGQAFSLIADGEAPWLSEDIPALLGRPARSCEQFATDFAAALGWPPPGPVDEASNT
jgi:hypothetical protein